MRAPLDWAMTQNNLGSALWEIGKRTQDPERLRQAVTAVRSALEVQVKEAGMTQYEPHYRNRLDQIQADLAAMENTRSEN